MIHKVNDNQHTFEWEVFGTIECSMNKNFKTIYSKEEYKTYIHSMNLVKKFLKETNYNSSQPEQLLVRILQVQIAEIISCDPCEIKIVPACHSELDFFHGVDAWIEFEDKIVTIQMKRSRPPSDVEIKADVLVIQKEHLIENDTKFSVYLINEIAGLLKPESKQTKKTKCLLRKH